LRIVHLYKDYHPVVGGIENHIRVLAEAQATAGHDVTALVCDSGLRTRTGLLAGVKLIRAGRMFTAASMPISLAQPLILSRQRPDIVHVQSPYPLGELSNWVFGRATASVISYQSDVVRQTGWLRVYGPFLRRVLRSADRIIASSHRYLDTSPWLAPVRAKCVVVPLSVDHQRFHPRDNPYAGPPTILFVGRLRYYKGLDTLLRAMVRLRGVTLNIVGTGPMSESWQSLAAELGLGDHVHFIGDVGHDELPSWYHNAHCFVLPANARSEAFGRVLLEAMASGLPCVTTELGTGTSWVVQDGVTGLVVPPRDDLALARAVEQLLNNPQRRREMGLAARSRVEAEFTEIQMVAGVQAVYEQALDTCH
jgi:rhamnosyl/mannosyltransferase